jgi:hypothetical protein
MKVIVFSLWGNNPMFCVGAIRNAAAAKEVYPEWVCRFYVDNTVPQEILKSIISSGCEIKQMPTNRDYSGLFWRMLPLVTNGCERFIVRDCDALVGKREAAAVKEWEDSGKPFHIMRDHHNHAHKIMGGMWGAQGGYLKELEKDIRRRITASQAFNNDQVYLANVVWPLIKDKHMAHDDRKAITKEELPFVVPMRTDYDFIGNKYKADGSPVYTEKSR